MEKRLIAPVIITTCVVLFCAFITILVFFIADHVSLVEKTVWLAVMIVIIGIHLYVLAERVKEIRSGEENDLGKY